MTNMMMPTSPARRCTLLWTLLVMVLLASPARGQAADEIPLGSTMPMMNESLPDVQDGQATLGGLKGGAGTVVIFWSNQCPWVERYESRVVDLVDAFADRGIAFVLVNSNDAEAYPQEAAAAGAERYDAAGYPSAVRYLSDPSSRLAEAFGAERTPHVYLFNDNDVLVYAGTIDDSPGDPGNVQETFLRDALQAVAAGSDVAVPQTKAFGCTIKFKS